MLSGNGRHRRPRQAPALLVAAGVTGSAIAIPLLGAGGASAAEGTTWDQVAECETGGAWSANEGDGYYGGLKLTQENWEEYGGLDYAPSADLASRNQQISVAEEVLADQGVGVWGTCGLLNGLSQDDASADVDTGLASGSTSDGSDSGSGSSSDDDTDTDTSPSASASASTEADTSTGTDNSTKSDNSDSDSGGSQSSDSSPIVPSNGDESDNSWQEGGSSSLVDMSTLDGGETAGNSAGGSTGKHRGAQADETSYTVREGDTLASIADSLGLDGGWQRLYAQNKKVIGSDPGNIVPGQTLAVGGE